MSEKKIPPSSSSSASSPSDQSLELLLGAIARGLDGLVHGNSELRKAFADLQKFIVKSSSRTENRVSELQIAIAEFVGRVEHVIEHQKTVVGSTVDARRALEASKQSLDKAVKDATGQFAVIVNEEGAAPQKLQVVAVWLTNFGWKNKAKLIGWTTIAATSIYHAIERIYPLINGWFR